MTQAEYEREAAKLLKEYARVLEDFPHAGGENGRPTTPRHEGHHGAHAQRLSRAITAFVAENRKLEWGYGYQK